MGRGIACTTKECVACGCCEKACQLGAAKIHKGVRAVFDHEKCVGCGKCAVACPASVISIEPEGGDASA